MKRAVAAAAAVLLAVTACNKPPETGEVTDYRYQPEWVQFIPGTSGHQSCSGGFGNVPRTCTYIPGTPATWIPWPESWYITVTNGDESGDYSVDEDTYGECAEIGVHWPECHDNEEV